MFISKQVKQSLYISVSLALVIIVVPLFLSLNPSAPDSKQEKTPMATNAFGVKVEKNPTQSQLTELGVTTWPKYVSRTLLYHPKLKRV